MQDMEGKIRRDCRHRALVRRARAGDAGAERELIAAFMPVLRGIASDFYYPGAEYDDAMQEGLYGFTFAIRCFDFDAETPFTVFASLVIRRHVITGLKAATRGKHRLLSEAERVVRNEEGDLDPIVDSLPSGASDPHQALMQKQQVEALTKGVAKLSEMERRSLLGVISGVPYEHIVELVGGDTKRVDNAVQRARRMLGRIDELREAA